MKRNQINRLQIRESEPLDPDYNVSEPDKNCTVYSPDGRIMEYRITRSQAESFCRENNEFTTVRGRPKKTKSG